ncbi:DUF5597 domain-containing protein [Arthrobacter sp. EH-1B-1]|uniref:DUF5597 domain-containing protein n=1 Tax=Arthrobacter vasquezii TaxID=2977629 RepID=A0ABT6CUS0_9MICC|nr:DUF5597 domain-containing protein [Arthrobacter vasquezii]MDF9277640.1 DUF5597 domain-containing protein [Arthrobacter vasquezii]
MTRTQGDATLDTRAARKDIDLPHLVRNGHAIQFVVEGKPFLALGGELHNSSASSPRYMGPVWERLGGQNIGSVIGVASWQLVEPMEGYFDFDAVDDQILQARARGIRLILIWFGSYKNADSAYAPTWVRRDENRFPRATRDPDRLVTGRFAIDGPILSVFNEQLAEADGRAFAQLMRHIREVDHDQTVIAVQVQNEVGLLGDSRDRSSLAEDAWSTTVPDELMMHLCSNRETLRPWLLELWQSHGGKETGTWEEVFGADRAAEEVFMSWGFSRFVEAVAAAGLAEYPLPMYTNAWLGPQPNADLPGQYPSGGPVARMMDVWKAGAPSLAFLAPDIYLKDITNTLVDFKDEHNPIFIPEVRPDAGSLFVALGSFDAIGFHVFGIEDLEEEHEVYQAYTVVRGMSDIILAAQAAGTIRGFKLSSGQQQVLTMGEYEITVSGPIDTRGMFGTGTGTQAENLVGYGLIVSTGADEFVVVARGASVRASMEGSVIELDHVQEGEFEDGQWQPGRTLNGDERYFMFPNDSLRTVRMSLIRRQPSS